MNGEINLTELEKDVLLHGFGDSNYNGQGNENGCPWSWSIADKCKVAKKNQVPGVISSLVKKGIMSSWDYEGDGNPDDEVVALTEKGKEIFRLLDK